MSKPPRVSKRVPRRALTKVRVSRRVSPSSRTTMVNSLLRNPKTAAVLRSAPNPRLIPLRRLGTTSLDGEPVRGRVLPGGRKTGVPSVSEFDWEAGIQFTPKSPGPTYTFMGRIYNTGSLDVSNLYLPGGITLTDLHNQDVLYLALNRLLLANLFVELPPETSTYMIMAQLPGLRQSDAESVVVAMSDAAGGGEVHHTLLSDGRGIVGLYTVNPYSPAHDAPPGSKMRKVSCGIHMSSTEEGPSTPPQSGSASLISELVQTGMLQLQAEAAQAASEATGGTAIPAATGAPPLHTFGGFVITRL